MSPYLLTVAAHATALSLISILIVACVSKSRPKAILALGCLIGVGSLAWLSPLIPSKERPIVVPISQNPVPTEAVIPPSKPKQLSAETSIQQTPSNPILTPPHKSFETSIALIGLWITGVFIGACTLVRSIWKVKHWALTLTPPDESQWNTLSTAMPREISWRSFRIDPSQGSPCISGFRNPIIIVPAYLLCPQRKLELQWALRHEMAHLDGQDSRWAFIVAFFRLVFWWNPLVHVLAHIWTNAREKTCDRFAAPKEDERSDYVSFLVAVAAAREKRDTLSIPMANPGLAKKLKSRITNLLTAPSGVPEQTSKLQIAIYASVLISSLTWTTLFAFEDKKTDNRPAGTIALKDILNPPSRLYVTLAIVKSSEPIFHSSEVLTAAELEKRIQLHEEKLTFELLPICQNAETDIFASWNQSTCTHDDKLEGIDLPSMPWNESILNGPFIGWAVSRTGRIQGNKTELALQASYAFVPGFHLAPGLVPIDEVPWASVRRLDQSIRINLATDQVTAVSFGEVERNVHVAIIAGTLVGKPWDIPTWFQPENLNFPSLWPKPNNNVTIVSPSVVQVEIDDPEYLRLKNLATEAHQAWIDSMDALPENAELVRQRRIHQRLLKDAPEDKAINWKLARISEAIMANATGDIDTTLLRIESETRSRASFEMRRSIQGPLMEKK